MSRSSKTGGEHERRVRSPHRESAGTAQPTRKARILPGARKRCAAHRTPSSVLALLRAPNTPHVRGTASAHAGVERAQRRQGPRVVNRAPRNLQIVEKHMTSRSQAENKKFTVLAGIDFSTFTNEVLATAANSARVPGGELHVVHVLPQSADGAARGEGVLRFANLADDVRARLATLAAEVPKEVARIDLHVRLGRPDVEIAQLASDIGADLVVVGTHSRSALDRIMIGSVAESLVRHCPCPLLTFRSKPIRPWEQIAPPCPDCLAVQQTTGRTRLWCDRHAQHHPRAHTYAEVPASYALGSQTFR